VKVHGRDIEIPDGASYAEVLKLLGGLATTGEHLGVMVAPESAIGNCPPGWVFVNQEKATPEEIQETLDHASKGRKTWPTPPEKR
jgi:hypothetical protein